MVKNVLIFLACTAACVLFAYFSFAFVVLDLNPLHWSENQRILFVFALFVGHAISFGLYFTAKEIFEPLNDKTY